MCELEIEYLTSVEHMPYYLYIGNHPYYLEGVTNMETMNHRDMDKAVSEKFYSDLNGAIYCTKHLGYEASSVLEHNPKAKEFNTSMTSWFRMTAREVFDFAKMAGGIDQVCESCRYGKGK